MIIKRIKIDPFGGLSGRELEFQSELNVIVGPNEAGKSTIFNAIQKVLLIPVQLYKKDFEREIERFLPIGGGDTVHVELHFDHDKKPYILKKTWGGTRSAELKLPGGSVITNDDTIKERLDSCLPATEGTVKSVLMTYQSGLERTIAEIDPETVYTLGDMLRKVVMETDGISVDEFKKNIRGRVDDYFSHWDREKQCPEKGRGITNPWKKEVGLILSAFYNKESIRVNLENALSYEEELDKLNKQIEEISGRINRKETFIKSNEKAVKDARERRILNAELKALQGTIKELKKVNSEWPVIESQIEAIEREMPWLEGKEKLLLKEKSEAEQNEESKTLLEKFNKVEGKKKALAEAEEKVNLAKRLTREDLDEIKNTFSELNNLKTGIAAGELKVTFNAKKNLVISIQKDLEEGSQEQIKAGDSLQLEAGGRIKLEHQDWIMDVISGEGDFEKIKKKYEESERTLNELLKKHEVETLEKATEVNREYERQINAVKTAENIYKDELGENSYEELKSKIETLGEVKETRLLTSIVEELVNLRNTLSSKKEELKTKQEAIEEFKSKFESKDQLLLNLADEVRKEKDTQGKIDNLAPLPEGAEDSEKFIEEYETIQRELKEEEKEKRDMEIRRAGLKEPEESSEELKKQLIDAEENFNAVLKKGESFARILDVTENILGKMDISTYQELERDIEKYVSAMTGKRYSKIKMEEGLPQGFIRDDGKVLFHELLSHGTKDVLGLALRLSMAKHFLRDADGFLLMDDPLVNLDPDRQKKAVEIINEYAKEKQILIFTCHPTRADLLSGHKIEL